MARKPPLNRPKRKMSAEQRAKLAPYQWKKGENPGTRISRFAMTAVKLARGYCPEAVRLCYEIMCDEHEATTYRLKAAELILHHGMPRGDNSRYVGEETVGAITLNLVMPKDLDIQPLIEGTPLDVDTPTQGNGD